MNFRSAWNQLKIMKHYLIATTLVFVVSIIMGSVNSEQFEWFINTQLETLKKIAENVTSGSGGWVSLFWTIFLNNARAALILVLSGIFFGIPSLALLIMNGITIGYISAVTLQKASMLTLLKGLAPHGILELPAILLASALGLRIGLLLAKWLISFASPKRSGVVVAQIRTFALSLVPLFVIIILTLLIAALIESTISVALISG